MTFILTALFGLVLTAGLVFGAYYIGYYGLYLIDLFEEWLDGVSPQLDKE